MASMIRFILAPLVVIAADVQILKCRICVRPWPRLTATEEELEEKGYRHGDGSGRIELTDPFDQLLGDVHPGRIRTLWNFIANAPKDNAGMISITEHHRVDISLPPLFEIQVIVFRILGRFPPVERLIDHQHAEPVAGVQERGRRRIVAATNRVKTIRLHQFDPTLFGPINSNRTQRSIVMVQATAPQLKRLAIDAKTLYRVYFDLPDPEVSRDPVNNPVFEEHFHFRAVQMRCRRRPQFRPIYDWGQLNFYSAFSRYLLFCLR